MLREEHAHLAGEILCTWSLAQTFVAHLELARFSANDLCAALQRGGESVLRPYASSLHSPPLASTRLQSPPICLHSPPRASNLSPLASTHLHVPPRTSMQVLLAELHVRLLKVRLRNAPHVMHYVMH